MAMLKALSHEDINDRSLDEHTLPPMLNPALLGSEETTLGSAMDHSCAVLSTSQFMRRSNMGAAASTTPSALRAPTPRAAASFVGEPFAQRSHKLTPLQAEVRRIRDHQIGRPGSAAAGDTEAAPMYLESMDIAAAADVSPMQLGSVPALSPMHLGEIPLHVVVRNTSRPLTPSMNADGTHFTLPLPHHTTCVGLAEPEVAKDTTPTSNATPTPGWAAPAIRAQAASSFRREGHGRAKEQVVQHHRVVLNSPVATPSSTGGCVPPLYSPPRDSSVVLPPSLRHGSGTITMWPPHSSFGHLHPNANSTDAFKSPCSETAPPSSTSQHSDGGRLPAPTTTAVPGVAWLSDSSSEGDHC